MTQFSTPQVRRSGGDMDVYTGLLLAAVLVLAAGVVMMALRNSKHSASGPNASDGSMFKMIEKR